MKEHLNFRKTLTNDRTILQMVGGCKIEFENYPHQIERPQVYNFGAQKSVKVDIETEKNDQKRCN